jgi:hypothetical protein
VAEGALSVVGAYFASSLTGPWDWLEAADVHRPIATPAASADARAMSLMNMESPFLGLERKRTNRIATSGYESRMTLG